MKTTARVLAGALSALALSTSALAATFTSQVGDRDNFGTDTPLGTPVLVADIVADDPGDGPFDFWVRALYEWSHTFSLPAGTTAADILSAKLTIVTADLEDDGEGDGAGGEPFDALLFVDGTEIPFAFDDVSTKDGQPITPNVTTFELDPSFFGSLLDGVLAVTLDPDGGTSFDFVAIDYAFLEIETVPVPPAIALFAGGLLALRLRKRTA